MSNINYDLYIYLVWALSGVALVFLLTLSIYYLMFWSVSAKPVPPVPHSDKKSKFAILIAARNESAVIRNIFNSLKEQTYDKNYFDPWVIVESEDDPTVGIAKEYGYHYFVRDRLEEGRKTKGFALQECIAYFKRENIVYDAYMVFDADNVMDNNYIEVMNDLRQTGVRVGLGYRNFTNANTNWLTATSAILFTYMNQITSRGRTILFHKATIMGTGYFIDAEVVDDAGGWIFTGMTEDIQITTYCYYHDIYMRYYPLVSFYDEQSSVYKTVHIQHLRWLFGYFERRKFLKVAGVAYDYHTKGIQSFMRFEFNVGLFPFLIYNIVTGIIFVISIIFGSLAAVYSPNLYHTLMIFGIALYSLIMMYLVFVVPAAIAVNRDGDRLGLSKKNKVIAIMTYMFFFYDFILCFFDGVFHPKKRKTWNEVKHTGEITNDDAKKAM